jgi:hypothetical protein
VAAKPKSPKSRPYPTAFELKAIKRAEGRRRCGRLVGEIFARKLADHKTFAGLLT